MSPATKSIARGARAAPTTVGDLDPSPEIQHRARLSLAAINAAKEYDADHRDGRGGSSAQLWEMARAQTAGFFGALSDPARLSGLLEPDVPRGSYDGTLGQLVADLKTAQTLLSGEMLLLLRATGYEPPPPAHKLIIDTSDLITTAVTASVGPGHGGKPRPRVASADRFEQTLTALSVVHERLVDLEGKSAKKVRREVSRLRRPVAILGSAAMVLGSFLGSAAVAEPVKDAIKITVEHKVTQLPGLGGIDFGSADGSSTAPAPPAPPHDGSVPAPSNG
jgi:hypothetical protein